MASSIQPRPPAISELRSGCVAWRSQSKLNTLLELSCSGAAAGVTAGRRGAGGLVTPGLYPKALIGASGTRRQTSITVSGAGLRHRVYDFARVLLSAIVWVQHLFLLGEKTMS